MQGFFSKKNNLWVLAGAGLLIIGFVLLAQKPADNKLALNVAPFVLLLAYVVVIPLGLMWGDNKDKEGEK